MEEKGLRGFKRAADDRWLGGICGALGKRTPVPSWAWRMGFVFLFLCLGTGGLLYLLLWIFAPKEGAAGA